MGNRPHNMPPNMPPQFAQMMAMGMSPYMMPPGMSNTLQIPSSWLGCFFLLCSQPSFS
jgi:hypothetical protein